MGGAAADVKEEDGGGLWVWGFVVCEEADAEEEVCTLLFFLF